MSLSTKVKTGLWVDQSSAHGYQVLQDQDGANWYKISVGLSLTLSTIYIVRIVASTLLGFWHWQNMPRAAGGGRSQTSRIIAISRGTRELLSNFLRALAGEHHHFNARHWAGMFLCLSTFTFTSAGLIYFGSKASDLIITDKTALLNSQNCGAYEYDWKKGGDDSATRVEIILSERERKAAEYAQRCYGGDQTANTSPCNLFFKRSIRYTMEEDTCPFDEPDICAGGYRTGAAVTFDTGILDSSVLGLNLAKPYRFRRRTTCAPLSIMEPYVRPFKTESSERGHYYEYGSLHYTDHCPLRNRTDAPILNNATLTLSGNPFEWMIPAYRVDIFSTSLEGPECDFYQPIQQLNGPGLMSPRNRTLTVIFVTTLHVLYTEPSLDPIFPAHKHMRFPGERGYYYRNTSPKSRPFACVDELHHCDPSGTHCWTDTSTDSPPQSALDSPAYWFMSGALRYSSTFDSIQFRLGSALLAQQRIGQYVSLPLENDHWKMEAEHLFRTSLARAQYDAWSIASGEFSNDAVYKDMMPKNIQGKLCGLFKFNSSDHVNVSVWLFSVIMLILPTSFVLSRETRICVDALQEVMGYVLCGCRCAMRNRISMNNGMPTSSTHIMEPIPGHISAGSEHSKRQHPITLSAGKRPQGTVMEDVSPHRERNQSNSSQDITRTKPTQPLPSRVRTKASSRASPANRSRIEDESPLLHHAATFSGRDNDDELIDNILFYETPRSFTYGTISSFPLQERRYDDLPHTTSGHQNRSSNKEDYHWEPLLFHTVIFIPFRLVRACFSIIGTCIEKGRRPSVRVNNV